MEEEEIWKQLKSPYTKYWVSTLGRIKNKYKILNYKPSPSGYINVGLTTDDGKEITRGLNCLIAEAFLENVDNKPIVDHINRIRDDNRLCNLRYADYSESALNRRQKEVGEYARGRKVVQMTLDDEVIKIWDCQQKAADELKIEQTGISLACRKGLKTYKGYKWDYYEEIIEGEIWKKLKFGDKILGASSHGRIKFPNGDTIYGNILDDGYMGIKFNYKQYRMHRIICFAFKPIKEHMKYIVNHKDKNPQNNHIDNLEWLSRLDNTIHRYHPDDYKTENYDEILTYTEDNLLDNTDMSKIKHRPTRAIIQFDIEGKIIKKYSSIAAASKELQLNYGNLIRSCKKYGMKCGGFLWKYDEDSNKIEIFQNNF